MPVSVVKSKSGFYSSKEKNFTTETNDQCYYKCNSTLNAVDTNSLCLTNSHLIIDNLGGSNVVIILIIVIVLIIIFSVIFMVFKINKKSLSIES